MGDVKYSKIKNGKDGLYELDFNELTEDLINNFENDSQSEINILKKMATESPEVLKNSKPGSPWAAIFIQLVKFDISTKIINLYEYQGYHYSLANYLKVRGNVEENMELIITGQLVHIALAIGHHKLSQNFEAALEASELLFGCGMLIGNALNEKYTVAGFGRYGEREDEGQAVERREKLNKIVTFVTPIIKNNPSIHMTTLSDKILKNKIVYQSPSVVYDYLKQLKKDGEIYN
ncbi:predicted carbonic anhydrase [Psychromonas ingrahamii 37]|uniref:Predicted carbonic anhydrase n=1 Tax=Psychromonas ingrahamii (strain DSM 17664 / CCUG 51855 / 37) TaxID=357804 RepID=A1SRZ6_PSYIN|nr:hypothetical protein [Psychromonas ingrahamii]ABM02261.1 predicted carbonic anhydrase [Psychromonas ingrahamii 37]